MTEILCEWLNNDVKLSRKADKSNIARDFSSGYYFGEIFHHYQLQDDFESFSVGASSNAKLNNFMKLEPTFHLLEIPFDANIAYEVMTQKYGVATRLLYQMYIGLQRKVKNNLTGAAMQTMRASAPVKLENIESGLYKERLKTLIPRESDLTLGQVSLKFQAKKEENDRKAMQAKYQRYKEFEAIKQEQRKMELEKSRMTRLKQTELLAKIQAATVHIPKPPPSKTLEAIKMRSEIRRRREAANTHVAIGSFEKNLKKLVAPVSQSKGKQEEDAAAAAGGVEYLDRIKMRLGEEREAREERAKRRRKVLVDQMKAHHAQEESHRQEQIVQRLMRQSQMERRVAVQLMQVRSEKDNIRKNRIFREKQYEERRLKDFQDALDLEAKLAKLAKEEYEEDTAGEKELHNRNMVKRSQDKYRRHYQQCQEIFLGIVDFTCKIIDYRHLTEKKVPEKLVREWKKLFLEGQPIYARTEEYTSIEMESQREDILNAQDFAEYRNMVGEWIPPEEMSFQKLSECNILGHILHRLFNMVHPPEKPPTPPKFPDFPVKAAVLGKMFAGKSSVLETLVKKHNIAHLKVDVLLSEAIEAYQTKEVAPEDLGSEDSTQELKQEDAMTEKGDEEKDIESDGEKSPKLSERALLGAKAVKSLELGDPVPDDILVGVLVSEIHKIPEGRGWILDGFPNTPAQAVLLEKALTGNDVSITAAPVKKRNSKTSTLVTDPKPAVVSQATVSGIDVVLILDASDEMVLKRSQGRTYELKQETMFHEEFSPAPNGSRTGVGSAEKVFPVEDKAFDKEQVQHRISAFHDNCKNLESFYERLSAVRHVDGEQDREAVFADVESTLFQTLKKLKTKDQEETSVKDEPVVEQKEEKPPVTSDASAPSSATSRVSKGSASPRGSKKAKSAKSERSKSAEKGSKSRSRSGSRKGSGKGKKKSRTPTPTPHPPEPEVAEGPPPPKPGEPDWVYVDEPLPMESARIAVPVWDNVEQTYITSCKHIFQQIRNEREGIIRYTYQSRNDFRTHLRRPDPKQAFVNAWQKDFNEVADDLREDEETKAEMHQRLHDLKERLWDICDTKKEEAEAERAELMSDGWLEDHLGLLINQYLSLMQNEIDRFHETTRLLKDYYTGMQNKIPVEDSSNNARLPLVELNVEEQHINPASSNETIGSEGQAAADAKKGKKGNEDTEGAEPEGQAKIPLIQRGATFTLFSDEGGKGKKGGKGGDGGDGASGDGELEEKTITDTYNTTSNFVGNLVQTDINAKEAELEEERRLKEEEERAKQVQAAPSDKKGGKGKGKSAKGKKGSKSKSPTPVPPTPTNEMSEEDKRKIEVSKNMKDEYFVALRQEESRVKNVLALIKKRAIKTLSELRENLTVSYAEMQEWLGDRYLSEMKSIESLMEAGQNAIENATKLKYQLCLNQDEFVVNVELKVARTPSPPPIPPPIEMPLPETFTVVQLTHLLHHFRKVSPSGMIANKSFTELLSDTALLTHGQDSVPESWLSVSYLQLTELCSLLSPDSEYVDWRKFLLAVSKPWSTPTMKQLVDARRIFQKTDVAENGWITEDQFMQAKIWIHEDMEDDADLMTYPRMKNLHHFFFMLFADWEQTPVRLDYLNMLMYFAMDLDPIQGYMRALSVAVGEVFPNVQKVLETGTRQNEMDDSISEVTSLSNFCIKAEANPQPLVSVQSWWLVMHHGSSRLSDSHRFSITEDPEDQYSLQRFQNVYETLEAENLSPLPFQLLLQHPVIQDAILMSKRFQLPDLSSFFEKHQDVDDVQSVQASIG